ncbi:hypothetical protein D3C80_2045520 [compost metagenome]
MSRSCDQPWLSPVRVTVMPVIGPFRPVTVCEEVRVTLPVDPELGITTGSLEV